MKTRIHKSVNRVGDRPWNHIYQRDGYREGTVFSKHGLVGVYCESGITVLRVVREGFVYQETREKDYTTRYLVTLANRFAARVKVGRP